MYLLKASQAGIDVLSARLSAVASTVASRGRVMANHEGGVAEQTDPAEHRARPRDVAHPGVEPVQIPSRDAGR